MKRWLDEKFLQERFNKADNGASLGERSFPRTPGQIDRDRILYSGHFLRLAEVTQTVSPLHGYVFHNRLSHSLKVGQVARRLCERLKRKYLNHAELGPITQMLDPDISEAVGLAHDLGHPPFGHTTEMELNRLLSVNSGMSDITWPLRDGFEGNAQSFRIVCRLAGTHLPRVPKDVLGLNLTRQTLNGILKYPYLRPSPEVSKQKWGAYDDDDEFLIFAREGVEGQRRSLEAEIMDWADDITFAVHDLLDFYASGQIPIYLFHPLQRGRSHKKFDYSRERKKFIDDLAKNPPPNNLIERAIKNFGNSKKMTSRKDPFEPAQTALNTALDKVMREHLCLLDSRYTGTDGQRRTIGEITFEMIEDCISDFKLVHDPSMEDGLGPWRVEKNQKRVVEIDILKQFTWHYIIRGQQLHCDQIGHRRAVALVFSECMRAARDPEGSYLFPMHFREGIHSKPEESKTRSVVDYVSSMSEPELMRIYRQLIADNGYRH